MGFFSPGFYDLYLSQWTSISLQGSITCILLKILPLVSISKLPTSFPAYYITILSFYIIFLLCSFCVHFVFICIWFPFIFICFIFTQIIDIFFSSWVYLLIFHLLP